MKSSRLIFKLLPLCLFIVLAIILWRGLSLDPQQIPSPLINKPLPQFQLPLLNDGSTLINQQALIGKVSVLNVWATWCLPCRAEHPLLMSLAALNLAPIYGLNYKDNKASAQQWLKDYGNPYSLVVGDEQGKVGIELGVYGVPETFIMDATGTIRYKHTGPIDPTTLEKILIPVIKQLKEAEHAST